MTADPIVIPEARREASIATDAARIAIDGCSLGGFVAIEVFLRHPQTFGALGTVQAAIGMHRAAPYAERIAKIIQPVSQNSGFQNLQS